MGDDSLLSHTDKSCGEFCPWCITATLFHANHNGKPWALDCIYIQFFVTSLYFSKEEMGLQIHRVPCQSWDTWSSPLSRFWLILLSVTPEHSIMIPPPVRNYWVSLDWEQGLFATYWHRSQKNWLYTLALPSCKMWVLERQSVPRKGTLIVPRQWTVTEPRHGVHST